MTKLVLTKPDGVEDGMPIVAHYAAKGTTEAIDCPECGEVRELVRFVDEGPLDREQRMCLECALSGDEDGDWKLSIRR